MSIAILGIDLGKNACSIVGAGAAGAVIVRRTMRRQTLIDYVGRLPTCVVAMEASAVHSGNLGEIQRQAVVLPHIWCRLRDSRTVRISS